MQARSLVGGRLPFARFPETHVQHYGFVRTRDHRLTLIEASASADGAASLIITFELAADNE